MERRKLTKEDIDKVRDIEGFPIGKDEDIIALSDAPYYTACPNPFIADFIKENGKPYDEATDDYHREPFAADVSEGKNDPLYTAHTYHTKVPYKAIINYILHYTKPGDVILDGFCGTGMAGIAATACGNISEAGKYMYKSKLGDVEFGKRRSVLIDLSPAATHISNRYNASFDIDALEDEFVQLQSYLSNECSWMYKTKHASISGQTALINDEQYGSINYTVWSDLMICPHCGHEFLFWDVAVDRKDKKLLDRFHCPQCNAQISKRECSLSKELVLDDLTGETVSIPRQKPVLIYYTTSSGKRCEKAPDEEDMNVIEQINNLKIPYWFPRDIIPAGDKTQEAINKGIVRADYFYQKRNLYCLALLWNHASEQMKFVITAFILRATKMNKVHIHNFLFGGGGWNAGYLTGVIYFPSLSVETSVFELFNDRVTTIKNAFSSYPLDYSNAIVSTQSTSDLRNVPANSIDYIFTDPPFGDNLMYSELSYIWECWLKVKTNTTDEAIINRTQNKRLSSYQDTMTRCFTEYARVLKPNRWLTVEFHNSKNAVWNAIQASLSRAGFIIADVRTLDKNQGSFNQVKGATQAIKQDLVISAYKPQEAFVRKFIENAGTEATAWDFVNQHLTNLPVVVVKDSRIEIITERQAYLLFDRMVAYHIMNGIPVPIDASDFYRGLDTRYMKRDTMYFLADQINEYDTARIVNEIAPVQFQLFVTNEKSAIAWLYQQLETPQTYQAIQPEFMKEIKSVDKFEDMPELSVLLEENFLQDDEGKWYIPDVTKEADVAKLREKKLLKEFEGYLATKGKLKLFRAEAVRVGFAKLWADKNYKLIVDTAERLPEQIIQEDDKLLMYYDISLGRV